MGAIEICNGTLVALDENCILRLHVEKHNGHISPDPDPIMPEDSSILDVSDTPSNMDAKWSDAATKLLIEKYREYRVFVENRTFRTARKMWERIKLVLDDHGFVVTSTQVESKWKSLERAFKTKVLNAKKNWWWQEDLPIRKVYIKII